MLEPFSKTVGIDVVRACHRKQLVLHQDMVLQWQRDKKPGPRPALPRLWILSPGVPRSVLAAYEMRTMAGWPDGFWKAREVDALHLVVVSQLPRNRATLLLRLLGRGQTRRDAVADLLRLPDDSFERLRAMPVLVAFRVEVSHNPVEELDMQTLQEVQAILKFINILGQLAK